MTKEHVNGTNPTIYGNGLLFIQPKGAFSLSIDAVDLQNIAIINSINQHSSIALSFQSLSITTKSRQPFISINRMDDNVTITMQSCILKSSNNNPWLNISMANANVFRSNIKLNNNTIEGGSFFLENVEEFELSESKIQNIHYIAVYKFPKVPSYIKLVNVRKAAFRSNTTINNSTVISFIYASNSVIDIENLHFRKTAYDIAFIVWKSNFKANEVQVVDCKLRQLLFIAQQSDNITIQRFKLQKTTLNKTAFVVWKSNFNAKEIRVFDCFVKDGLFISKDSANITIQRFELENTTIDKNAFIVSKTNFNAKEIQVVDCFVKTGIFHSKDSDNITIQRFELQNTKIDDDAFVLWKSNLNANEIQVVDCFVKDFLFYGIESDDITIQRFELQNTTIDENAFVLWKSNFKANEIQVFDCFVKTGIFYSNH